MIRFLTVILIFIINTHVVSCASIESEFLTVEITLENKTFKFNAPIVESLAPDRIENFPDVDGDFKCVGFTVPIIKAHAADIKKLDSIIAAFDPASLLALSSEGKTPYTAYLKLPKGEITGGVVLLHGSGGIEDSTLSIAREMVSAGKVVIMPHLFAPHDARNVKNDQMQIPLEQSVVASYSALHLLNTLPSMANKETGLVGISRGGLVADLCARTFYQEKISPKLRFSHFVIIDGFVFRNEKNPAYTGVPMLFMHGELDNWTPLTFIKRHVAILRAAGYPTELKVFAGGAHSFLKPSTERSEIKTREVQTYKNCTFIDEGEAGFRPLIYSKADCLLTEGDLMPWNAFPNFLATNVTREEVSIGGNGEHTKEGLETIRKFFDTDGS